MLDLTAETLVALQLPSEHKFSYFDADGNMQDISVDELTKGKKVLSPQHSPRSLL